MQPEIDKMTAEERLTRDYGDLALLLVDYGRALALEQSWTQSEQMQDTAFEEAQGRRLALEKQIVHRAEALDLPILLDDGDMLDAPRMLKAIRDIDPTVAPE